MSNSNVILLLSYFLKSGALDSFSVLLSSTLFSITFPSIIILITALQFHRWSDSFNNANSRASRLSGTAAASSNASTALPAAELIPVCVVMPNNPRAVREQRIPSAPWVDPEEREQTRDE